MSAFRHPEVRIVSCVRQIRNVLDDLLRINDSEGKPGLLRVPQKAISQLDDVTRQLRASSAALQAQTCATNARPCPCCAGAGRKRREIYMGAGRYSDGGMVGCLTCEGRGEVGAC